MKVYNEDFNLSSEKINKNYTFVCLADLHINGSSYKLWDKVLEQILLQNPDYIFIPGDIVHSADDLYYQKYIYIR